MITGKVNGTVGFLCSTVPAIIILIYLIRSIDLLKIFRKEFATTLKVMRAFPENKLDFSPHERSSKAKSIMSTFIFEMYLMELNVFGKKIDNSVTKPDLIVLNDHASGVTAYKLIKFEGFNL